MIMDVTVPYSSGKSITIYQTKGRDKQLDSTFLNVAWESLRFQHTTMIKTRLLQDYSESSVIVMLSALRGVIRTTWKLGLISAEDYHRAVDIKNAKAETIPAGCDVRPLEIKSLLDTCNLNAEQSIKDVRDAALLGVLYSCSLRHSYSILEGRTPKTILRNFSRTKYMFTVRNNQRSTGDL